MKFPERLLGTVALLAMGAAAARAGTMTVLGEDVLHGIVTVGGTHGAGTIEVGLLDCTESTLGNIRTVCADLDHPIGPGQSWPDTIWLSSTYPDAGIQLAGNVVAADFASVTTADQAVGLQLDVWELRYDGGAAASPDFSSGNFTATGMTAGALAAANSYWLDRFRTDDALFIRAEDGHGQDQLTPRDPVPEPASLAVLGIGAFALMRRGRTSSRQASVAKR